MNNITHFSRHAIARVEQRSKLQLQDIAEILDAGKFVDTGCEPGFNRHHLLFYSEIDNEYFVAVQDRFIGKVITLLPLDYHRNLAWKISKSQCFEAKRLIMERARKVQCQQQVTNKVKLCALYLDADNKPKVKSLAAEAGELYSVKSLTLKTGDGVIKRLTHFISQSGLNPKAVYGLSVRLGKKGTPNFLALQTV